MGTFAAPPGSPPSRRAFMRGVAGAAGAFVLGACEPFDPRAVATAVGPNFGVIAPSAFLKIGADNSVTLICKRFEMGQGVATGLATLVAEELGADWSQMRIEFAPNDAALYNNLLFGPFMVTGGSTSCAESWFHMRQVGAAARMMFVGAAAASWKVPSGEIAVENGFLLHRPSNRRAALGSLAAEAMAMPVPGDVPLKSPDQWTLIGRSLPRLDSAAKTDGSAVFALDVRRPGMLRAVIRRPELFGATVASFDATEARRVDGVTDVVEVPSGVAVIARDTWAAMRGRDALKVTWDAGKAETRSTREILAEYRGMADGQGLPALRRGDAAARLARAARTVDAEFTFPYLAHAPMEPLNCVIELRPDGADLWSGCQVQSIDDAVAARVLGLKPEQVRIHTLYGGGSFGRRGNPAGDWVAEVAAIAKAIGGRAPIQLVWTREDDIRGGYYRPLTLHRVRAGVGADGGLAGWRHKIVCQSIFTGTPLQPLLVKDGVDHGSVEGVVDTAYLIPDLSVEAYNATSPVPVLWWRSVGHGHSAHVMETVVDELAALSGRDPVAFRLALLDGRDRDAAVLRLAADKAGWGRDLARGRGRGAAYHRSFDTRVAMIAEVSTAGTTFSVDRIVAAVDCGVAVNPDVVAAQIEGAIGFALSSVLRNQVTLERGVVQQRNFDDYEPTRMREMPKVEVHIVRSIEAPSGIGEPGVPLVAPAIGNALFAATGRRLRSLPLDLAAAT